MSLAEADRALLDFLQEPVLVLARDGTILQANAAAARLLGRDGTGDDLAGHVEMPGAAFRAWLSRCSGSTSPHVGMLPFRQPDGGVRRMRAQGARLRDAGEAGEQVRIGVRCTQPEADGFARLKRQIAELNAEAHERRRRQALLEEALQLNEVLLRELNHRVKNNIQLMVGLFSAAIRETRSPEVRAVLHSAVQRLLAVGAAQTLMYRSKQLATVPARPFVDALTRTLASAFGEQVRIDVAAEEGRLSTEFAFPLALILNELVTNAVKHGLPDGAGTIGVGLERSGDAFTLSVSDNGPGIDRLEFQRHSSGLGLVRGLCRQIGAQLDVENDAGARVLVRFASPQEEETA
jgi:two-component sensor histidine kinase